MADINTGMNNDTPSQNASLPRAPTTVLTPLECARFRTDERLERTREALAAQVLEDVARVVRVDAEVLHEVADTEPENPVESADALAQQ